MPRPSQAMHEDDLPETIFSDLSRKAEIDGHRFMVQIFRSDIDPSLAMTVENAFGTQTAFEPSKATSLRRQRSWAS